MSRHEQVWYKQCNKHEQAYNGTNVRRRSGGSTAALPDGSSDGRLGGLSLHKSHLVGGRLLSVAKRIEQVDPI